MRVLGIGAHPVDVEIYVLGLTTSRATITYAALKTFAVFERWMSGSRGATPD
jgi:hypothetical protein